MAHVFFVQHVHPLKSNEDDLKVLGIYSTEKCAVIAVERMRALPGFYDVPDGFSIDDRLADEDHWTEGHITAKA
jgi:hypothetical protein